MNKISSFILLFSLVLISLTGCEQRKIKALIVSGQNNHNWQESHLILKKILENSHRFVVDISLSPEQGEDMSTYAPVFDNYDVVVLDYNGDEWPENTKTAFEDYVKNGGGVVVYHAANNAFPKWKAYNEMCGLGGWNGRDENSGPYVFYNRMDELILDHSEGSGGTHGPQHEFIVKLRQADHPIVKGLPLEWMHSRDELYSKLRGPAKNMTILATAYANPRKKGTGRHEPTLMTIDYEEGRIFHTVLGHVGKGKNHYAAQSAGFIITLQRGAEWAATGEVNQELPKDLPNVAAPFILPNYAHYSLTDLFEKSKNYKIGKSQKYLNLLSERFRKANGNPEKLALYENKILQVLNSKATDDCKNYLCKELSWFGGEKSIATLQKLKQSPGTSDAAEFALGRIE